MFLKKSLKSFILIVLFLSIGISIFYLSNSKKKYAMVYFTSSAECRNDDKTGFLMEKTMEEIFEGSGYEGCFRIYGDTQKTSDSEFSKNFKIAVVENEEELIKKNEYKIKDAIIFFDGGSIPTDISITETAYAVFPLTHEISRILDSLLEYFGDNGIKKVLLAYDETHGFFAGSSVFFEENGIEFLEKSLLQIDGGSVFDSNEAASVFGKELAEFSPDCFLLACTEKKLIEIINGAPGYPRENMIIVSRCDPAEISYYCGINSIGVKLLSSLPDTDFSEYPQKALILKGLVKKICESFIRGETVEETVKILNSHDDSDYAGNIFYENNHVVSPVYFLQLNPDGMEMIYTYHLKKDVGYENRG